MNRNLILDTLLAKLAVPPLSFQFAADIQANQVSLNSVSLADLANLLPGMPLRGLGLGPDCVLATVDPPTMSVPAISTGIQVTIQQGVATIGRRLKMWTEVPVQPALFLVEANEEYPPRPSSAPARSNLDAFVWVYYRTTGPEAVPAKVLNGLLDGIEAALTPPRNSPTGVWQNLGLGTVIHARIEGHVLKDPGHLDGQAIARVPLVIQVAQTGTTKPL
jgi:hypothetical protein